MQVVHDGNLCCVNVRCFTITTCQVFVWGFKLQFETKYQSHIDGLRAIAVLSVVLHHLHVPYFSGGYVGVDIFFVISGFLITRLILNEILSTGTFQFSRFYVRRLRRLGPALLVTLFASAIAATFLFTPDYFQSFGESLVSAVLSVSNFYFWSESGYFDIQSRLKPLLHTWSLSVEEQFYLIWPIFLLFVVQKIGKHSIWFVLVAIGIVSLAANVLWVNSDLDFDAESTIFYFTPFRVFEFAIGGLAVFCAPLMSKKRWIHEVLMLFGLLCIAFSIIFYTGRIPFPYYYALLPCVGAFCMIVSSSSRIVGAVINNPIAVGIGLISYSLYLVHWPLIVFYEYYIFESINSIEAIGLFVVSVLLAYLMYRFVELPFRKRSPSRKVHVPQRKFVVNSIACVVLLALLGFQISATSGWGWRFPNALSADLINEGKQKRFMNVTNDCQIISGPNDPSCNFDSALQVLVFGNSHEPDGYNIFNAVYGERSDVNLINFGTINRCDLSTILDDTLANRQNMECYDRMSKLIDREFVNSLDVIIASFNRPFARNKKEAWKVVDKLMDENPAISLVLLGSYINTKRDCTEIYNRLYTFEACTDKRFVSLNPFNERKFIRSKPSNEDYLFIDKTKLLCLERNLSSCKVTAYGEPYTYDDNHMSLSFAKYTGERMLEVYSRQLKVIGFP